MHPEFEAVIGLEIHCQLSTETKAFCCTRARLASGQSVGEEQVNSNTCPVCTGHPGTLPVLSRKAVEYAVRAGLATHCTINKRSVFARKNYFYPDLPKGYQISQYELPLCEKGWIDIDLGKPGGESVTKRIGITRIHMEEDAGKNVHMQGFSLVNFNRASVPLIEIVSEPEMRTPEEAGAYMRAMYAVVTYLGICDGNLQEGNFRCDANVSVRPKGQQKFGTRAEIKNVNSFRYVEKAIEYEIARQIEVVTSGGTVVQETRLYDPDKNVTRSMRSKEEAHDYRYFPDPDLPALEIEQSWIDQIGKALPELPEQKRARYMSDYGLSKYDAGVLTGSRSLAAFYEEALRLLDAKGLKSRDVAKPVANYTAGEISRLLNEKGIEIGESRLTPQHLCDLIPMVLDQSLSSTNAKQVIALAWETGDSVPSIVEAKGLRQVSDLSALEPLVEKIIAENPQQAADFRAGKEKLLGYFVGQAMKASKGQGNPALFNDLFRKKLKS